MYPSWADRDRSVRSVCNDLMEAFGEKILQAKLDVHIKRYINKMLFVGLLLTPRALTTNGCLAVTKSLVTEPITGIVLLKE